MSDSSRPKGAAHADLQQERLNRVWMARPGVLGWLGAVNHKQVGRRYVVTGIAFFIVGGVLALLMRVQLGTPDNTFLTAEQYNQLFSMHGTTMMFLFAVPITEGIAIYLVPLMLGQRDMPFPRLNAFGYWVYLFGGVLLYTSFLTGSAPDGGWFAYTPFTGPEHSPGLGMDFWLLGVTFVEIAGIVAAIELVVLVLRGRAPGMTWGRIPLFVWSSFVTAVMVLFAFPPLVVGSLMLELDRKFGTAFYDPALGGDPHLWQHIFWWFGHPEVYIMLLPAIGVISMIVPTFARTRIVGYVLLAASTVAIGIISFGLWVHHMYAAGLPLLALSFFAAGSLAIAIPSGIQVFGWIATIWVGRVRWDVPMLYVVGFLVTFVMGGVTGVMVAIVPFDWQVHDSFFVVAHFHYIILGGVVMPLFGGFHYWLPKVTGRMAPRTPGVVGFWLVVSGVNLTFFPQHYLGLIGMPRRVYTFPGGLGWELHNLVSTVGAVVTAAGFAVAIGALVWGAWRGAPAGPNPWGAGTLEWATASPPPQYNFQNVPYVSDLEPLWAQERLTDGPEEFALLAAEMADPEPTQRELLLTGVLDAQPDQIVTIPAHSLWPLATALAIGAGLVGVLVDAYVLAGLGGTGAAVCALVWAWDREDDAATDEDWETP